MITRIQPRFSIDRKTGQITCHKELTEEERKRIQIEVLKKQTELHPELLIGETFRESNKFVENIESGPSKKDR